MTNAPRGRSPARAAMWLLVAVATYGLYSAVRAAQAGQGEDVGLQLAVSGLCIALAGWIGMRTARERLRVQEKSAAQEAQMMVIAQLGQQDDATLERMARSGGATADAARMILQGRHLGNPAGRPRPDALESE